MEYTQEEIQRIVSSVIEIIRKSKAKQGTFWDWLEKRTNIMKPKDDLPLFYPEYYSITHQAERIRVHAEPGIFPEELFLMRSPNMIQKEFDYIKGNFKQTSLPVFIDFINTLGRCFADDNWNLTYEKGDELQEYLEKKIARLGSLEIFVKTLLPTLMTTDAMGVMAIDIPDFELLYDEDGNPIVDKEGNNKVDEGKELKPQPYFYPSKNILAFKEEEYYLILMHEKTLVDYNGKKCYEGLKFAFYDKDNIWHISQTGKYTDYTFTYELRINHNWDRVPVKRMGGIPKIICDRLVFVSPFIYVADLLDIVLLDSSNIFISKSKCVYPYRISVGDVCEFKDSTGNICIDGTIFNPSTSAHYVCPSCNGMGLKSRITPMGELLLKPKTREGAGDELTSDEAMKFVAPDVTTLEFLRKEIQENIQKSKQILHIYESNTEVHTEGNVTATGMAIDMKAMYAFIKPLSDQVFGMWEFLIDGIGFMRYGSNYKKPTLYYPTSFDFLTEQDYLFAIGEAKKAMLPPFIIETKIKQYLQSIYYSEEKTARVFRLISAADRLLVFNDDEIAFKLSKGLADKWESVLHDSALNFIDEMLLENTKFFEMEFGEQIDELIAKAKEVAATLIAPAPAGTETQTVVTDILNA